MSIKLKLYSDTKLYEDDEISQQPAQTNNDISTLLNPEKNENLNVFFTEYTNDNTGDFNAVLKKSFQGMKFSEIYPLFLNVNYIAWEIKNIKNNELIKNFYTYLNENENKDENKKIITDNILPLFNNNEENAQETEEDKAFLSQCKLLNQIIADYDKPETLKFGKEENITAIEEFKDIPIYTIIKIFGSIDSLILADNQIDEICTNNNINKETLEKILKNNDIISKYNNIIFNNTKWVIFVLEINKIEN